MARCSLQPGLQQAAPAAPPRTPMYPPPAPPPCSFISPLSPSTPGLPWLSSGVPVLACALQDLCFWARPSDSSLLTKGKGPRWERRLRQEDRSMSKLNGKESGWRDTAREGPEVPLALKAFWSPGGVVRPSKAGPMGTRPWKEKSASHWPLCDSLRACDGSIWQEDWDKTKPILFPYSSSFWILSCKAASPADFPMSCVLHPGVNLRVITLTFHLGCFHLLAFVKNGAMSIGVEASVWVPAFSPFGSVPKSRAAGSCGKSVFNFLRNRQTVFHSDQEISQRRNIVI